MNTPRIQKNTGFTVVETLVAISILTISILGTFTAVQNSLQSSSYAKDQIVAFYLAQEAVEYIRNVRDENGLWSLNEISQGHDGRDWLYGLAQDSGDPCYFNKNCRIDVSSHTVAECTGRGNGCMAISQDSATGLFGYSEGGTWSQTRFNRTISFEQISQHEVLVKVNISWTSGLLNKTFDVRENLFDWQ